MDLLNNYGSSDEEEEDEEEPTSSVQQKTGRKVLSLANVLPQHILNQLLRDSQESDDEDAFETTNHKPKGNKEEMSDFLSELNKSAPAMKAKTVTKPPAEKMGAAFLQTTSTVVQKKHDDQNVRDIHSETSTVKRALAPAPPSRVPRPTSVPKPAAQSVPMPAPPPSAYFSVQEEEVPTSEPQASRKRSRKDIERELRQGNLAAIDDQQNVSELQQAGPYHVDAETYAVPEHGVKVVPTAIYNPSTGGASATISNKGRGKNQINHLMQSAAALETARARGLASSSQIGKMHRKKAKEKYGW